MMFGGSNMDDRLQFLHLPTSISWDELIASIRKLEKTKIKTFLPDHINGSWLDFSFSSYEFSINDQLGTYWFFANDPSCPEDILLQLTLHFKGY
jgi:hypothetical protein